MCLGISYAGTVGYASGRVARRAVGIEIAGEPGSDTEKNSDDMSTCLFHTPCSERKQKTKLPQRVYQIRSQGAHTHVRLRARDDTPVSASGAAPLREGIGASTVLCGDPCSRTIDMRHRVPTISANLLSLGGRRRRRGRRRHTLRRLGDCADKRGEETSDEVRMHARGMMHSKW